MLNISGDDAAVTCFIHRLCPAVGIGIDEHACGASPVDEFSAAGSSECLHLFLPAIAFEGEVGLEEVAHELIDTSEILLEVGVSVDETG